MGEQASSKFPAGMFVCGVKQELERIGQDGILQGAERVQVRNTKAEGQAGVWSEWPLSIRDGLFPGGKLLSSSFPFPVALTAA